MPLVKLELKSVLICLWQYLDVMCSRFYIRVSLLRKMYVRLYLEGRWRFFSIWNRLDLNIHVRSNINNVFESLFIIFFFLPNTWVRVLIVSLHL